MKAFPNIPSASGRFGPVGRTSRGFTLVELLVVLAVMGLLVGAFSLMRVSRGLQQQTSMMASVLDSARALALARQDSVRVVFLHNTNSEGNLQNIRVIARGVDEVGDEIWEESGNGYFLRSGVYLDLAGSQQKDGEPLPTMEWAVRAEGSQWIYVEYDASGACSQAGGSLIFMEGRPTASGDPEPRSAEARDGFLLRRHGGVIRYEEVPGS